MNKENNILYKIKSAIFGLAVGDALGVPVEFASREELDGAPVFDMEGFGTYPYPAGACSDDTSMSLCALDSLAGGRVDYNEIMKNFSRWMTKGEYTSVDVCFDIGGACHKAINRFLSCFPALACGGMDERSNGNGALMRILPFVLFCEYCNHNEDDLEIIHTASSLTHAHERSKMGCGIYSMIVSQLLREPSLESVKAGLENAALKYKGDAELSHYKRIFDPDFKNLRREEIRSSGYVVDTLEAALWCLMTTDSYKDCVLKAVNLGEDTDTVAAVAGGMAGALYGYDGIPAEWVDTLLKRDFIENICERAFVGWQKK